MPKMSKWNMLAKGPAQLHFLNENLPPKLPKEMLRNLYLFRSCWYISHPFSVLLKTVSHMFPSWVWWVKDQISGWSFFRSYVKLRRCNSRDFGRYNDICEILWLGLFDCCKKEMNLPQIVISRGLFTIPKKTISNTFCFSNFTALRLPCKSQPSKKTGAFLGGNFPLT